LGIGYWEDLNMSENGDLLKNIDNKNYFFLTSLAV
jgi:hypothetical protein